ncbi:MAG: hypothetical protein ACI90U_003130 [Pseudomonadales bacterium]|jgi:uncharacterized protein YheU (UPF0270 family)
MIIPENQLPAEKLRAVIENFIPREGIDYGETEYSLDDKVEQILLLIKRKQFVILFDKDSESISLMDASEAKSQGYLDHDD